VLPKDWIFQILEHQFYFENSPTSFALHLEKFLYIKYELFKF